MEVGQFIPIENLQAYSYYAAETVARFDMYCKLGFYNPERVHFYGVFQVDNDQDLIASLKYVFDPLQVPYIRHTGSCLNSEIEEHHLYNVFFVNGKAIDILVIATDLQQPFYIQRGVNQYNAILAERFSY